MSEQHEMILEETYPSGAQEWYCPLCERRLLVMNWHPDARQLILNLGDEASHTTISLDPLGVEVEQSQDTFIEEDSRLDVWNAWLDGVDFDSLWNGPIN
jgi:hypothetical protein